MDPQERYDHIYVNIVDEINKLPIADDRTTTAMKNLQIFSKSAPPAPEPIPKPTPEPTTRRGKLKAALARAWDNETTRVFIKAGGAFAGVAAVTYTTIHRDHVVERQAIAQANQRND